MMVLVERGRYVLRLMVCDFALNTYCTSFKCIAFVGCIFPRIWIRR